MFAASKTAKAASAAAATDPQFPYVTMLLHGDGTNGAQNNTFLDSSTNNFTITRNGNTTQGTFSPYGSNWSNYFSNSYLTTSASAYPSGTGDFTIEGWIFLDNTTANATKTITCGANTNSLGFRVGQSYLGNINGLGLTRYNAADNEYCSYTFSPNTWYHIAVVRSSATIKFYINGTQQTTLGSGIGSYSLASAGTTWIASNTNGDEKFAGSISNLRITNTAVYTSSFTPPTAPISAVSGTLLLTCQSNRFVDNSSNAFALTTSGTPSVQRFSPFSPTTSYSTSVIGGSGYFDGNGDYLNTTSTQVIPSGSFTVEAWVYPTSSADSYFVAQGSTGNVGRFSIGITSGAWYVQIGATNINTSTVVLNQWTYVAATFNGTTLTLYVNGTSVGTGATVINAQNTTLRVGSLGPSDWGTYYWTGYIGPVRISNTVRTISAPTSPYTSDANTTCLLSCTNAGILDNAMMNDLETVGNAQISTSVKKYGSGSMYFDGTADYLKATNTLISNFGSGAFTVEAWVYFNSVSGTQVIAGNYQSSTVGWSLGKSGSTGYFYASFSGDGNDINGTTTVAINTWYHVAISGTPGATGLKLFVNGVQEGSTYTGAVSLDATTPLYISDLSGLGYGINGYIDDLRITKGYARYTSNFSVPTAAFPNN